MPHQRILSALQAGLADLGIVVMRDFTHQLPQLVMRTALGFSSRVDRHLRSRLTFAYANFVATPRGPDRDSRTRYRRRALAPAQPHGNKMQHSVSSQHALDQAIALSPAGDDTFIGHTSPAYANMVGLFGGIIAATLLNAVMKHPARLGE